MIEHDKNDNPYIDVENVRVSWVNRQDGWNGPGAYLRIQAYRGEDSRALHHGAELPVGSYRAVLQLVAAVIRLAVDQLR